MYNTSGQKYIYDYGSHSASFSAEIKRPTVFKLDGLRFSFDNVRQYSGWSIMLICFDCNRCDNMQWGRRHIFIEPMTKQPRETVSESSYN